MIIQELQPERWPLLQASYAEMRSDEPLPKVGKSVVLAGEVGGEIVATISAEHVWCVSGMRVQKGFRGLGVAEKLGRALMAYNTEGLTEMLVTTNPHIELLVHRLGFTPLRGTLWRRD